MFFSDKIIMDNYIDVVVEVLSNKDVIATFVMVFFVMMFGCYVANYRKKPKKQKKVKAQNENAQKSENASSSSSESSSADDKKSSSDDGNPE